MRYKKGSEHSIGHGCHRCPLNGKGDDRCISCQWRCRGELPGTVSLDAMLDARVPVLDARESRTEPDDDGGELGRLTDFFTRWIRLDKKIRDVVIERYLGIEWKQIAKNNGISYVTTFRYVARAVAELPELAHLMPNYPIIDTRRKKKQGTVTSESLLGSP